MKTTRVNYYCDGCMNESLVNDFIYIEDKVDKRSLELCKCCVSKIVFLALRKGVVQLTSNCGKCKHTGKIKRKDFYYHNDYNLHYEPCDCLGGKS